MNGGMDADSRDEIYSIPVKAGKRTYFFDVKCTRNNDYYLTITESKKVGREDSTRNFEKHKIFLYKEDFEKFMEGMADVMNYIKEHNGCFPGEGEDDTSGAVRPDTDN